MHEDGRKALLLHDPLTSDNKREFAHVLLAAETAYLDKIVEDGDLKTDHAHPFKWPLLLAPLVASKF